MINFFFIFILLQISCLHASGEKVPFSLLKRLLPLNPVIVESGAQFGEDTLWMSEMWPKGSIHAFEPSPTTFSELQKTTSPLKNVSIYPLALSDREGEFFFYLAGGASSLLKPQESFNRDYFHSDLDHPITVTATTLDKWSQVNGVPKIDFLWFDMEGNELHALEGAINSLKNVTCIYTEVNLQKFWEGCVQYNDLKAWLKKRGYEEVWSDIVPSWHGNALFVNTRKE